MHYQKLTRGSGSGTYTNGSSGFCTGGTVGRLPILSSSDGKNTKLFSGL